MATMSEGKHSSEWYGSLTPAKRAGDSGFQKKALNAAY